MSDVLSEAGSAERIAELLKGFLPAGRSAAG